MDRHGAIDIRHFPAQPEGLHAFYTGMAIVAVFAQSAGMMEPPNCRATFLLT